MSNWLKEPLLHFLFLGGLVFLLYSYIGPNAPSDDEIVVTMFVSTSSSVVLLVPKMNREGRPSTERSGYGD